VTATWCPPQPQKDDIGIPYIQKDGTVSLYNTTQNGSFQDTRPSFFINVQQNQGFLENYLGRILEMAYIQAIFWSMIGGVQTPGSGYVNAGTGGGSAIPK